MRYLWERMKEDADEEWSRSNTSISSNNNNNNNKKSGTKKTRFVAKVQDGKMMLLPKHAQCSLSLHSVVHVLLCWWESGTIQYIVFFVSVSNTVGIKHKQTNKSTNKSNNNNINVNQQQIKCRQKSKREKKTERLQKSNKWKQSEVKWSEENAKSNAKRKRTRTISFILPINTPKMFYLQLLSPLSVCGIYYWLSFFRYLRDVEPESSYAKYWI